MNGNQNAQPLLDIVRKRNAAVGASNLQFFLREPGQTAAAAKVASGILPPSLPKGIGAGKVTAVLAAVSFVGAGLYMATRKAGSPPGQWASRIDAERASSPSAGSALRV